MHNDQPEGMHQALVKSVGGWQPSSPEAGAAPVSWMGALRRHPLLAALTFVLICGSGGPFIMRTVKPVYAANSVVYVSPTFLRTLREDREQQPQYNNYVQQQMLLIVRYDIIAKTIEKLIASGVDPRLPGESERSAGERLGKSLEITHVPESYQISIGLHEKNPVGLAETLNTLTDTFIETSRSEEFYGEENRIGTLHTERGRIQAELDQDLKTRADIARDLSAINIEDMAAARPRETFGSRQREAKRNRIEAEAQLAVMEHEASVAGAPSTITVIAPADQVRKDHLNARRDQLLLLMAPLSPKNPDYRAAEREMTGIDQLLREIPKSTLTQPADPSWAQMVIKARIELERARRIEADLGAEIAPAGATNIPDPVAELQREKELDSRIERLRTQLNAIDDRLSYFRIERSAPGFLRVFARARIPVTPAKNNRNKYLAALAGLALSLSVGMVLLIDLSARKIVTASDIERILGFPPIGVVLRREGGTDYFATEQFIRTVNNVERVFRNSGSPVFLFTPVGHGDFNDVLVNNISHELRARGISAGVAGAHALRPYTRASELQMVTAESHLDARSGTDRRRSRIPGPGYRADPTQPKFPYRTAATPFPGLIQEMLVHHELVLLDGPPLLLSAEAEYLAALDAVTFLTVESGKVTKSELKRAAQIMEKLRPAGIAVVLHGVSIKSADSQLRRRFREFEACRTRK